MQCLLKAAMLLKDDEQKLMEIGIVGDGEQRQELELMAQNATVKIHFYGTQPMESIPEIMEQYDVLVLPSLHDGWGAVVNEALTLGLYVICSDHCGAKMLVKEENNGIIFPSNDSINLMHCIYDCIKQRQWVKEGSIKRRLWSKKYISGKSIALYFLTKLKI